MIARRPSLFACAAAAAAAGITGCSGAGSPPPHDLRAERLAALETSARKCGYPRSGWELVGTQDLRLKPNPDTPYQVVDCMLTESRRAGLPMKMGFVGNEAYELGNAH